MLFLLIADVAHIHMKKLKTRKSTSSVDDTQEEKERRSKTVIATFLVIY